jgi:hypothetical protein
MRTRKQVDLDRANSSKALVDPFLFIRWRRQHFLTIALHSVDGREGAAPFVALSELADAKEAEKRNKRLDSLSLSGDAQRVGGERPKLQKKEEGMPARGSQKRDRREGAKREGFCKRGRRGGQAQGWRREGRGESRRDRGD